MLMTGYSESGLAHPKFVRRRASDGAWWNTSGTPAFEAYDAAHIANYGIAAVEVGTTGVYTATDPASTVDGNFILINAAGASLTVLDVQINREWTDRAGLAPTNITAVNDIPVGGSGSPSDPWGPT